MMGISSLSVRKRFAGLRAEKDGSTGFLSNAKQSAGSCGLQADYFYVYGG
jgi:hypothetical protein